MAKQPQSGNDVVEELPAEAKPTPPAKAGGSWLPVILVVVLLPILSFAMTEFVLIPRIKKEIGAPEAEHEAAAPKSAASSHGSSSSSHGGGGGHGGGGSTANTLMYEFGTLKTNLSKPASTLIIVKFTVRGSDPAFSDKVQAHQDMLIDATLKILSLLTLVDTQTPGIQNVVKNDLIASFNEVLGEPLIENLFFTDFVTQ